MLKKIGSVVKEFFLIYQIFFIHLCRKTNQTLTVCLKIAIKNLGSAQKIRVGRESGNTTVIFLGLTEFTCRIHRFFTTFLLTRSYFHEC